MVVQQQRIMKSIEISDDIYTHLLQNVLDFGEQPDGVLRRLLKLPHGGTSPGGTAPLVTAAEKSAIQKVLESTEFTYAKGVVGKFLVLLRSVHDTHKVAFDKVLHIKGRGRLYFAKDAITLEKSGTHVNPKQIPGTAYWVITT